MIRHTWVWPTLIASALSACAVGPNYRRPDVATPAAYKEAPANATNNAASNTTSPPQEWWTVFNDPLLNDLEQQVEVSNQDLAAAEAAYREAATVIREQRSALFPSAGVSGDASRTRGASRSGSFTPSDGAVSNGTSNTYQVAASASWEIDLWGRIRRSVENARALADASAADLASAKLSLQGQLAIAYLQLREADAEQRLVDQTVVAFQRSLDIAQNRYKAGVAAKTDVLQARTQLANAQDQAVSLQLQRAQLEHAIASLVGKPAGVYSMRDVVGADEA